jgi:methyl-accepting chemotaxis protein
MATGRRQVAGNSRLHTQELFEMTTLAQNAGAASGPQNNAVKTAFVNLRRRRTYLIDAKTQLTITRQFVFVLLATAGLSIGNYHVFRVMLDVEKADSFDRILSYGYCAVMLAVCVTLLFLLCVFFTHRIAGPARKISEALDQMAHKNLCVKVRLRDTDLLKELAEAVNAANKELRGSLTEVSSEIQRARNLAAGHPELVACLQRIERQLSEFHTTQATQADARQALNRGAGR